MFWLRAPSFNRSISNCIGNSIETCRCFGRGVSSLYFGSKWKIQFALLAAKQSNGVVLICSHWDPSKQRKHEPSPGDPPLNLTPSCSYLSRSSPSETLSCLMIMNPIWWLNGSPLVWSCKAGAGKTVRVIIMGPQSVRFLFGSPTVRVATNTFNGPV